MSCYSSDSESDDDSCSSGIITEFKLDDTSIKMNLSSVDIDNILIAYIKSKVDKIEDDGRKLRVVAAGGALRESWEDFYRSVTYSSSEDYYSSEDESSQPALKKQKVEKS